MFDRVLNVFLHIILNLTLLSNIANNHRYMKLHLMEVILCYQQQMGLQLKGLKGSPSRSFFFSVSCAVILNPDSNQICVLFSSDSLKNKFRIRGSQFRIISENDWYLPACVGTRNTVIVRIARKIFGATRFKKRYSGFLCITTVYCMSLYSLFDPS